MFVMSVYLFYRMYSPKLLNVLMHVNWWISFWMQLWSYRSLRACKQQLKCNTYTVWHFFLKSGAQCLRNAGGGDVDVHVNALDFYKEGNIVLWEWKDYWLKCKNNSEVEVDFSKVYHVRVFADYVVRCRSW